MSDGTGNVYWGLNNPTAQKTGTDIIRAENEQLRDENRKLKLKVEEYRTIIGQLSGSEAKK